ncbi:amidohydrolase ytcJ-like [Fusarium albosuccineum]|uniref:Amidohydrolase ytcJ-like n=1 Tax=Fusarium albosuccineum TaxID=1237068 RepID=A0A8H4NXM9_9HYPO|nr:amidohydrolase ytcJ-like [Fusarium albosuccineum]
MARGLVSFFFGALLAAAGPATAASYGAGPQPADLVLTNGQIYTMGSSDTPIAALAISGGKIAYVGSKKTVKSYIRKKTKVINLKGRMAMPGPVDSHMHVPPGGLFLLKCDLSYQALALEDVIKHIQGCIDDETDKTG